MNQTADSITTWSLMPRPEYAGVARNVENTKKKYRNDD